MKEPVSIFIMDVSKSTRFHDHEQLSDYLSGIVDQILECTSGIIGTKMKHRFGDEIIFVGEHFISGFIIAAAIRTLWKFRIHEPYFGFTFGYIDRPVETINNVDTWNHPLIKNARIANDRLKEESIRSWIHMKSEIAGESTMKMCNMILRLQQNLLQRQTNYQRTVHSLHYQLGKQSEVAQRLSKTPATISNQLKQGNSKEIFEVDRVVAQVLSELQEANEGISKPCIDLYNSLSYVLTKKSLQM